MITDDLSRRIENGRVAVIGHEDLESLLQQTDTLRDHDTSIAGHLRILGSAGRTLVQEQTPEGQLLVRELPSVVAAQSFIEARLAAYERMWDG